MYVYLNSVHATNVANAAQGAKGEDLCIRGRSVSKEKSVPPYKRMSSTTDKTWDKLV